MRLGYRTSVGSRSIVVALASISLLAVSTNASSQLVDAGADAASADGGALDAQAARKALDRGIVLLAENPPDRAGARASFESAVAASDKQVVAEAHLRLGSMDEEEGAYPRAFEQYQACAMLSPTGRLARNARMRVNWLQARSEGDFVPLSRLSAVRRDPAFVHDPAVVEAFVREADGFPPGIVRSEARMAAAEALLAMRRADQAMPLFVQVRDDPRSLGTTVALAEDHLVEASLDEDRLSEVAREVEQRKELVAPELAAKVQRAVRKRVLRDVAALVLAIDLVFAGATIAWAWLRRARAALVRVARALVTTRSAVGAACAYATAVVALLLFRRAPVPASSCVLVAAVAIPVVLLLFAAESVGSTSLPRRVVAAALCVAGIAAGVFLVLEAALPAYLNVFGL
jgi:hypothetical protein